MIRSRTRQSRPRRDKPRDGHVPPTTRMRVPMTRIRVPMTWIPVPMTRIPVPMTRIRVPMTRIRDRGRDTLRSAAPGLNGQDPMTQIRVRVPMTRIRVPATRIRRPSGASRGGRAPRAGRHVPSGRRVTSRVGRTVGDGVLACVYWRGGKADPAQPAPVTTAGSARAPAGGGGPAGSRAPVRWGVEDSSRWGVVAGIDVGGGPCGPGGCATVGDWGRARRGVSRRPQQP